MAPFGLGRAKQDRRASGDGIAGQALVLRGDSGYSALSWWTSSVWLRVSAPGVPPAYVVHRDRFHRDRAPVRGFVLAVDVDPNDWQRLQIRWDETPTIAQRIADGDPAILDPEGTWRRVTEARGDQLEPSSGMSRAPAAEQPWGDGRIDGWPPSEPLDGGRLAATALVVARSDDPGRPSANNDYILPCSPFGGLVADDLHSYTGWLLLCVIAPSGSRYGVHVRTSLRRGHLGPVLPVAIHPDKPDDVEIPWRYAPDRTRELAEQLRATAAAVPGTADRIIATNTEAADKAVAQIEDPAMRSATEEMLRKFGMTSGEEH
jgi:hypothetical protein